MEKEGKLALTVRKGLGLGAQGTGGDGAEKAQEETCIPFRNSRILPQLEKKHVGPPSALDEALAHYSARILKWVAMSFSRGSSQPRD